MFVQVFLTCKGVWSHLSAGVGVAGKLDGATEVSLGLGRPRGHWGHVTLEWKLVTCDNIIREDKSPADCWACCWTGAVWRSVEWREPQSQA